MLGPSASGLGQRKGLVLQFGVRHHAVHQADALAALGVDPLGGEHQLARPREPTARVISQAMP